MTKRVVVWGTGFVGRMVIAEIVKHPSFDLVGVGVSNPDKVGRDVGEICGLGAPLGLTATDDVDALIALQARRAGALRPDGRARRRQHRAHHPVPAGGHRRVLDVDDAVGVARDAPQPAELDRADHRRLRGGPVVVLHHRHRPRLRQRPVPDDADGAVLARSARCGRRSCWTTPTTRATTSSRWASASRPSTGRCSRTRTSSSSLGAQRFR